MSVILDALKRVQEENRRRSSSPERLQMPPDRDGSALLRRLGRAGGAAEQVDAPGASGRKITLTPTTWVALGVLALVVIAAIGLWWFQPNFAGPQARHGQPLLTDLTAVRPSTTPNRSGGLESNAHPAGQQQKFGEPLALTTEPDSALAGTDAMPAGTAPSEGQDLSDLSGKLTDSDPDQAVGGGQAQGDDSKPLLKLEVTERPTTRGDSSGSGSVQIRSSSAAGSGLGGGSGARTPRPAQTRNGFAADPGSRRVAAEPRARKQLPEGLVDPGVRAAFREGVRLQKAGDLAGAEEAYRRALKYDPHNSKVNANLGVLYESEDRLGLAEQYLRQAIAVQPDNAGAHNNLGVVLYRQGNYDAALIEFNRTLQLDPNRLDAYTNKGLIFTRWGQLEKAERSFLQVLALDPDNALAHYNLGLVYEQMDLIGKAVDHYYEFLSLGGSEHPDITTYLANHLEWLEARLDDGASSQRR